MSKDALDREQAANRRMRIIADDLYALAGGAGLLGLIHLANNLEELADNLREAAEESHEAMSQMIHEDFLRAQEATGNMLCAALAGVAIATREETP